MKNAIVFTILMLVFRKRLCIYQRLEFFLLKKSIQALNHDLKVNMNVNLDFNRVETTDQVAGCK